MKHEPLKILDEMRKVGQMPRPETLAVRLSELNLPISATELPTLISEILRALGAHAGHVYVTQMLALAVSKILESRSAEVVCDPWAGPGVLLATAQEVTNSTKALRLQGTQESLSWGAFWLVPQNSNSESRCNYLTH